MNRLIMLCCCLLVGVLGVGEASKVEAANQYSGVWSSYSEIGNYGMNQVNVVLKESNKQINVEATSAIFKPLNDTQESYEDGIGKKQHSVVSGSVKFDHKGQASFSYKDKYSNGKMDIRILKGVMHITWKGTGTSNSAFPNGSVKLFKKVATSQAELKKMGVFLSNFTELRIDKFNLNNINDSELIHFGVWHNYINNYEKLGVTTKDDKYFISKKNVEQTIYKYFNIKFKNHKTVDRFIFNKQGYSFVGADGEAINYVRVQRVYDLGNNKLRLSGQYYDPDEDTDEGTIELKGEVEAVVKVQKENKITRYVLEKLRVK